MINEIEELFDSLIQPCEKCPYKLGLIQTFVNPCPQCRMNNYSFFHRLMKELYIKDKRKADEEHLMIE